MQVKASGSVFVLAEQSSSVRPELMCKQCRERRHSLVGKRFGRWTVITLDGKSKRGQRKWLCRCDCGEQRVVFGDSLTQGSTKSCGCLHREVSARQIVERSTKHGHCKRAQVTGTYVSWISMISRCTNPNNVEGFAKYGAKGVGVCPEWRGSFEAFLESMGDRPTRTTLGRVLDMGNYETENCFWMTPVEQGLNRSNK